MKCCELKKNIFIVQPHLFGKVKLDICSEIFSSTVTSFAKVCHPKMFLCIIFFACKTVAFLFICKTIFA